MKMIIILSVFSTMVFSVLNAEPSRSSSEEATARKARMYKKTGGHVFNMAAMRGSFQFVNAQSTVRSVPLEETAKSMATYFCSDFKLTASKDKVSLLNAKKLLDASGAQACVFIVEDPALPALMIAPEMNFAFINVTPLVDNDPDVTIRRIKLEMWRSLAFLCGTDSNGCMMRPISSLKDLDELPNALSAEKLMRIPEHLENIGIIPFQRATYKRACEEGWAPQPTNDVQKAIWEKAKSEKERGPTNPIQIKP